MALKSTALVCLWLILAARTPQVARHRDQRLLWAAVALLAAVTTLYTAPVQSGLAALLGAHVTYLGTHLVSVTTAAVTLHCILVATGRRRPVAWLYGVTAATLAVLLVTYLGVMPGVARPGTDDLPPAYNLLVSAFSVVALGTSALVCATAVPRARGTIVRWALLALAAGWVLNALPWVLNLLWLLTEQPGWIAYFAVIDGLSAVCLAVGAGLPTVPAFRSHVRESRVHRRLHPLWRGLTADVPDVVLGDRGPRNVLPGASAQRAVDRRLVEIRDAMRELRGYVGPEDLDAAGATRERAGEARVMAAWLVAAQRAKRAGRAAGPHAIDISGDGGDREAEIAFLLDVAAVYGAVRADQRTDREVRA